ncbi:MAG TPA: hypothetical protein VG604_00530 [Candidatus Saccharimonadales bacterium]|nr:hypothetical protein [Candidatus Saccharimonadales bacterium]
MMPNSWGFGNGNVGRPARGSETKSIRDPRPLMQRLIGSLNWLDYRVLGEARNDSGLASTTTPEYSKVRSASHMTDEVMGKLIEAWSDGAPVGNEPPEQPNLNKE